MQNNKNKIILDLCGGTGAWAKPWKDNGYQVHTITLPDYDVEKWREYPDLVKIIHSNKVVGILAAPPVQCFLSQEMIQPQEKKGICEKV